MKKFRFQRLKIIEQIAIVFFFAVVIPMSISGFIINNINQQSVRHQLRESAMLIASMVSDEIDFLIKSNGTTLAQIADTLEYIPNSKRTIFLSDIEEKYPHCDKIYIVKTSQELEQVEYEAHKNNHPVLSKQMANNSYLVVTFNSDNMEMQIFKSIEDDIRQVYILDRESHLVASHNYTSDVYKDTISLLPPIDEMVEDEPVVFGDEKNQPIVYLKAKNNDYIVIVRTTKKIAKQAIIDNRVKIILAVLFTILSTMIVIGFYMFYLYINVRQLFKAIMALSKGNYEHQIRLLKTSFTPYELVFLANEFNAMASEIHKSYLELKHKNKELKELNEFRSNLLDTVSHELRTPLTSIQGYTSRLMRQDIIIDEETKQKSLRIIKEQSERLKRLIDDLLTIPDIEGMRLRTVNTSVQLEEVLNQSELLLRKHDGHEIVMNIDNDFPAIYADKGRLEQVFVNLFENAVKYAYPETTILVDAVREKGYATITVKNRCDKISHKKLSSLFEKFVRLDDHMTRTTRGTGLGLFIVKGLVEAMEGKIALSSNDEFGFVVTITLKLFESMPEEIYDGR